MRPKWETRGPCICRQICWTAWVIACRVKSWNRVCNFVSHLCQNEGSWFGHGWSIARSHRLQVTSSTAAGLELEAMNYHLWQCSAGWPATSRNHCLRHVRTVFFSHNNQIEQYFSVLPNMPYLSMIEVQPDDWPGTRRTWHVRPGSDFLRVEEPQITNYIITLITNQVTKIQN